MGNWLGRIGSGDEREVMKWNVSDYATPVEAASYFVESELAGRGVRGFHAACPLQDVASTTCNSSSFCCRDEVWDAGHHCTCPVGKRLGSFDQLPTTPIVCGSTGFQGCFAVSIKCSWYNNAQLLQHHCNSVLDFATWPVQLARRSPTKPAEMRLKFLSREMYYSLRSQTGSSKPLSCLHEFSA